MKLTVCICDLWHQRHYYNRPMPQLSPQLEAGEGRQQPKPNIVRRLTLQVDAIKAHYLLHELLQQKRLSDWLEQQLGVQLLWLSLHPPKCYAIDYRWAGMLLHGIYQHIELEQLMCWLSTLGGGYSSLGDQYEHCAQAAGNISLQQLKIGMRLGNPNVQARCKLYYSISLIQRGQLRQAKQLIRAQYKLASRQQRDHRLVHMCQGIWQRLCHEYAQKRKIANCK